MTSSFCYWSVATGEYAEIFAAVIASARAVGVEEEFHVWTDRSIPGAVCHPAGQFDNWGWLFKLVFLRDEVSRLPHDIFVYLDADSWFVRPPGNPSVLLRGSPLHVTLEADLTAPDEVTFWWEYPTSRLVQLMRAAGLADGPVYSVNAGLFIVRREAIPLVYSLTSRFWRFCREHGVLSVDEPLLAYAMQALCGPPLPHSLAATHSYWATDWEGTYRDRLPDGQPFPFRGYHRQLDLQVNPAIVHAIRGKAAILRRARDSRSTAPGPLHGTAGNTMR